MTNNDPNSNPAPATLEVPLDAPEDWEPEGDTEPEDDDVCLEGDNHDHAQDAL